MSRYGGLAQSAAVICRLFLDDPFRDRLFRCGTVSDDTFSSLM
jgi:hypothetical protein